MYFQPACTIDILLYVVFDLCSSVYIYCFPTIYVLCVIGIFCFYFIIPVSRRMIEQSRHHLPPHNIVTYRNHDDGIAQHNFCPGIVQSGWWQWGGFNNNNIVHPRYTFVLLSFIVAKDWKTVNIKTRKFILFN